MDAEAQKRAAAARAVEFVRSGMRLGLGTGSTARHFVELVGERVRGGLDVVAVPTSQATKADAERCGIPLTTLDDTPELDLTVDGADEIAPDLSLIKGGGGALLREKIVAAASARMIVIADQSKLVGTLGRFPLPIEVAPFGLAATRRAIERAIAAIQRPGRLSLRPGRDGHAFVTDGGHWIIDAALDRIDDPQAMAHALTGIPGVMEHGLFIGLAQMAIVAGPDWRQNRRAVLNSLKKWSYEMNVFQAIQRVARLAAAAVALAAFIPAAHAQQPSAASLAVAKQLITTTGATTVFNPLIAGVVEQAKNLFLQQDPGLAKDLNEVAAKLRTDLQPRFAQLNDEVAKLYATNFTEQELKDILAFYQSPAGKKMLTVQPKVIDSSMAFAPDLGEQAVRRSHRQDAGRNEEARARAVIARMPSGGSAQRGK